jgi:hypothetical protein
MFLLCLLAFQVGLVFCQTLNPCPQTTVSWTDPSNGNTCTGNTTGPVASGGATSASSTLCPLQGTIEFLCSDGVLLQVTGTCLRCCYDNPSVPWTDVTYTNNTCTGPVTGGPFPSGTYPITVNSSCPLQGTVAFQCTDGSFISTFPSCLRCCNDTASASWTDISTNNTCTGPVTGGPFLSGTYPISANSSCPLLGSVAFSCTDGLLFPNNAMCSACPCGVGYASGLNCVSNVCVCRSMSN